MYSLAVQQVEPDAYRVMVTENGSTSVHVIWVSDDDLRRYGGDNLEDLVLASMRFLLEREPVKFIQDEFDLPLIEKFFPDYRKEIKARLMSSTALDPVSSGETP